MSKGRVICLVWCSLMLALCIWMCGCSKSADSSVERESQPEYHITIYKPNGTDIFAEGDGEFWRLNTYSNIVKVEIDGKTYFTQWANVIIERDTK